MRRRRAGIVDGDSFTIQNRFIHAASGIQLFMGQHLKGRHAGHFATGWIIPGDETSFHYRPRLSQSDAKALFRRLKKESPPDAGAFKYDSQQGEVYSWENRFSLKSRKLDVQDMTRIAGALATTFNMVAPDVAFKPKPKSRTFAEAELAENRIIMYRPNLALLLHEFAHLVDDQVNRNQWAFHGPGFMRTYLSILAMFPEIGNTKALEKSARTMGIKIAPASHVPACQKNTQDKISPTPK